jgi:hypothetical protein
MSQTINDSGIPTWMVNIVRPVNSFESEISNKIGPYPHYPGPIHNIGGLRTSVSHCRIPGVQPFVQSILRPTTCIPHCLTKHCFEYGNTRFAPTCGCGDKYDCRAYNKVGNCQMAGWTKGSCDNNNCSSTCGSCNHNSNVIFQ